jgi:SAM-dependent methyltransferase
LPLAPYYACMTAPPPFSGTLESTLRSVADAKRYHRWLAEVLAGHLEGTVLEIGAGIGTLSLAIADLGVSVLSSEPDPALAEVLETRAASVPHVRVTKAFLLPLSSEDSIPGETGTILLSNVLEHVVEDVEALSSIRSVCPNGTRLALVVPSHPWAYTTLDKAIGHQRRYTKRSLATSCEEAGWHVLFMRYFNPIGALTWFLSGKILRRSAIAQWQTRAIELAVPTLKAVDRLFGGRGLGQSLIAIAEPEERPHA